MRFVTNCKPFIPLNLNFLTYTRAVIYTCYYYLGISLNVSISLAKHFLFTNVAYCEILKQVIMQGVNAININGAGLNDKGAGSLHKSN